jgi:hypothetical protein
VRPEQLAVAAEAAAKRLSCPVEGAEEAVQVVQVVVLHQPVVDRQVAVAVAVAAEAEELSVLAAEVD